MLIRWSTKYSRNFSSIVPNSLVGLDQKVGSTVKTDAERLLHRIPDRLKLKGKQSLIYDNYFAQAFSFSLVITAQATSRIAGWQPGDYVKEEERKKKDGSDMQPKTRFPRKEIKDRFICPFIKKLIVIF